MNPITRQMVTGVALLLAAAFPGCDNSNNLGEAKTRIVLVAKNQAFHLENQPEIPNPPITLKRGEVAALVLRNEDATNVLHCFSIGGLNVKTSSIDAGQSTTVTLRPTERGTLTYACLMHPSMSGRLIVE
jgi:heme/copper-type cytochrome/quinol oxidase subunit 2